MSETHWIVKTDESFYDTFNEVSNQVKVLGNMFQNNNLVINKHELHDWVMRFKEVTDQLDNLRYEALTKRIQLLKQEDK